MPSRNRSVRTGDCCSALKFNLAGVRSEAEVVVLVTLRVGSTSIMKPPRHMICNSYLVGSRIPLGIMRSAGARV